MSIVEILVKQAADLAAKVIESKFLKSESKSSKSDITPNNLQKHLTYIANWSGDIQLFGIGIAKDTSAETIALLYHESARKFRGTKASGGTRTEQAVIDEKSHILLIGDPGAGKTTSLKRLARNLFQEPDNGEGETSQLPILIRLKEINEYQDIRQLLAEILGFRIQSKEKILIEERKRRDYDDDGKEIVIIDKIEKKVPYPAIGDIELNIFIDRFLDDSCSLLMIDGLDELKGDFLPKFMADIRKFSLQLSKAKIIITCRTGFYYTIGTIEGFNVLDILPLDSNQIQAIASLWIKDPEGFTKALRLSPYNDLADRPLLLAQLLLIFDRYETLPKYPREIYELILELLLKEWDADRQITRASKYSDFTPKRKLEFLAELAFCLMYRNKSTQFGTKELMEIYSLICEKFELPKNEAPDVASEIETHTGIVISVGQKSYEFAHLSIQEYLCAEYIVRSPLNTSIVELIKNKPEPVAVAIALASDSTDWLCNLMTDQDALDALSPSIGAFVYRLVLERPVFRKTDLLGYCIFSLYTESIRSGSQDKFTPDTHEPGRQNSNNSHQVPFQQTEQMFNIFKKLSDLPGVKESVRLFFNNPIKMKIHFIGRGQSRQIKIDYTLPRHHISGNDHRITNAVSIYYLRAFAENFGVLPEAEKLLRKKLPEY